MKQQLIIPRFRSPLKVRIHPAVELARETVISWVNKYGLLADSDVSLEGLVSIDPAGLAARVTSPSTSNETLVLVSKHLAWLFVHDDLIEGLLSEGQHDKARDILHADLDCLEEMGKVSGCNMEHEGAAEEKHPGLASFVPVHSLLRSRSELDRQLQAKGGDKWYQRFKRSQARYFMACIWEADNDEMDKCVPESPSYKVMRRMLGGVEGCVDLLSLEMEKGDPRDDLRDGPILDALVEMTNNHIIWSNDVIGVFKEMKTNATSNLIFCFQKEEPLLQSTGRKESLQTSILRAAAECEKEYDAIMTLSRRITHSSQNPDSQAFLGGLFAWLGGHIDWVKSSGRFKVKDHPGGGLAMAIPPEFQKHFVLPADDDNA